MFALILLWLIGVAFWLCCAQIVAICQQTDDAWYAWLYEHRELVSIIKP
jgi:hypothetical protein